MHENDDYRYCPYCGHIYFYIEDGEVYIDITKLKQCEMCHLPLNLKKFNHEISWYFENLADEIGDPFPAMKEEIKNNPLYNKQVVEKVREDCRIGRQQTKEKRERNAKLESRNILQCPGCSSTNVIAISNTKKVTHGLLFGLFSRTAVSQFECKNCGYKW